MGSIRDRKHKSNRYRKLRKPPVNRAHPRVQYNNLPLAVRQVLDALYPDEAEAAREGGYDNAKTSDLTLGVKRSRGE